MAFPMSRARETEKLIQGDKLLLYTTRGCFRNPSGDRGRVVAEATLASGVSRLMQPILFGDRQFDLACKLDIKTLAPRGQGVELAPLVSTLDIFPNARAWSARLRTTLVQLTPHDARVLAAKLRNDGRPLEEVKATYDAGPRERPHKPFGTGVDV
jgi:hypothetical protein